MGKRTYKEIILMLVLFVFLGTSQWSSIPKTHSKYKSDQDYALIYNNQFYDMTSSEIEVHYSINNSTSENFMAFFYLEPNQNIGATNEESLYILEIPEGCHIEIPDDTNVLWETDDDLQLKISGSLRVNIISPTDNPNIVYEGNHEHWRIPVRIYEKVGDEERFLYHYGYAHIESKPGEDIPPDTTTKKEIWSGEESSVYEQLCQWLDAYISKEYASRDYEELTEIKSAVLNYVKKYENNVFDDGLLGLSIKKETISGRDKYTFELTENFVGYARTANYYADRGTAQHMYFSTQDESTLNSAFSYYYQNYIYPDQPEKFEVIQKYLSSLNFNAATYILTGTPAVRGIEHISEEHIITSEYLYTQAQNYVNSLSEPPVVENPSIEELKDFIPFATREEMLTSFENYMGQIRTFHPEYTLSNSAIEKIKQDSNIRNSMTKNSNESAMKIAFSDYFMVLDEENNNYLITKASSDGVSSNTLTIDSTSITREMIDNIQFINDESQIHVTLTLTGSMDVAEVTEEEKGKIKNIVSILDQYFAKTSNIDDAMLIKENGLVTLQYSIPKN